MTLQSANLALSNNSFTIASGLTQGRDGTSFAASTLVPRRRMALLAGTGAALLLFLLAIEMAGGQRAASYLAGTVAAAALANLLYQAVQFRVWAEREGVQSLRAAHSLTSGRPFEHWVGLDLSNLGAVRGGSVTATQGQARGRPVHRWLGLDLCDLGTVHAGSADAAMHAELGTITSERLKRSAT